MKNIFIGFFALIFINISCSKTTSATFKQYIVNQTQHDLTLTLSNYDSTKSLSINLLKNSNDSIEIERIDIPDFSALNKSTFKYKNNSFPVNYFSEREDFNSFEINFNINKRIKFCIYAPTSSNCMFSSQDSFFLISNQYNTIDTPSAYRQDIRTFFFTNSKTLYLLPKLYDSAR